MIGCRASGRRIRAGLSIVETLIASAVLAVGAAAVCETVVSGHMQTREALVGLRGEMLLDALMQEIVSRPYHDPQGAAALGPDAGESTRSLLDNVDDFHGYTDGPSNLADAVGAAYPADFQSFTRSVTVTPQTLSVPGLPQAVSGVSVLVTVQDTRQRTWTATRFVADPGDAAASGSGGTSGGSGGGGSSGGGSGNNGNGAGNGGGNGTGNEGNGSGNGKGKKG